MAITPSLYHIILSAEKRILVIQSKKNSKIPGFQQRVQMCYVLLFSGVIDKRTVKLSVSVPGTVQNVTKERSACARYAQT